MHTIIIKISYKTILQNNEIIEISKKCFANFLFFINYLV